MKQQRRDQGQINSLSDSWLSCSRDRASQLQIQHVQTADNWSVMTNVSTHSCVSPDPCVYKAVLECKRKKKKSLNSNLSWFLLCVLRYDGESRRQQPATTGGHRFSVLEAVRRLRGQNCGPFPPLHHGQLLAQPMPQVLLLPGPAGWDRHIVLHKKWHDPL